jgi:hypothetical protein
MVSEIERLEKEIQELLAKARDVDQEEDEVYGKNNDAHPIDEDLKRRKRRLEVIRKAKAELEEEARKAKVKDLPERAERQRRSAATESTPTERKRKLTWASRTEERTDRLAGGKDDEPDNQKRFSLRGVFKVRAEWTLVCLCHNLIKLLAPQPDLAEA